MDGPFRTGAAWRRVSWLAPAAAGAVLVLLRLHAFALPLETDECNYAYIGTRLLAADRLYVDVWDHQPPGVFVLFAGLIAAFGRSDAVFRGAAIVASLASLVLVHRIALRGYGALPAILAATLFAITSSDPGTAGEGCNREIFMNVCTLAALTLLAGPQNGPSRPAAAGLLLGLGSAIKTVVAAHWLVLAAWVVVDRWRTTGRVRTAWKPLLWFSAGPVVVWAGVTAYFAATGRGSAFVDAVFGFNLDYSGVSRGFGWRFLDFFTPVFHVFGSAAPLWFASLIAAPLLIVLTRRRHGRPDGAIAAYGLGAFLAVCLPGRFWPHYYHLLMPAVILICVAATARLAEYVSTVPTRRVVWAGGWLWVASVAAFQWLDYARLDPPDITAPHPSYRYRQAWSRAQGRRIAKLTDPDDTVFVWGRDAGVYYYANRRCASRYTMVGALADATRNVEHRRDILLAELNNRRPRIVLVVEPEFPKLQAFLKENYRLASPRGVDRDDDNPDKIIMAALADVDRPVKPINWEWPESP